MSPYLLVVAIIGLYLRFVDPNYLGLANFGSLWAILMLVKHLLIFGMIGMGFRFNTILRVGPMTSSNSQSAQTTSRFRRYVNLMTLSGVLVLFLAALAQVE